VLLAIGLSHGDASLADIQHLEQAVIALPDFPAAVRGAAGDAVAGAVLLATCNRVEIYLDASRFHDAVDAVTGLVASITGWTRQRAAAALIVRVDMAVAPHLFRVGAGLDSMVIGEAQISAQVSAALRQAQRAGFAGPVLNLAFQSAARAAKRVAAETRLHRAGRSLAAAALDTSSGLVPPWGSTSVLLIGTGAYARVVASALVERGVRQVAVYSSSGRQQAFAASRGMRAVAPAEIPQVLACSDLVITCSGIGPRVLTSELLDDALVRDSLAQRDDPLPVVDLALRHDVRREVAVRDDVMVIDLNTIPPASADLSGVAVAGAERIVAEEVHRFHTVVAERRIDPAVSAFRHHVATAVRKELDRVRPRIPPDTLPEVEKAIHRVSQALLHTPTVRAHALARNGNAGAYLDALRTLYGIEVPASGTASGDRRPRHQRRDGRRRRTRRRTSRAVTAVGV
jgi:glutamyl-tRNA reductase